MVPTPAFLPAKCHGQRSLVGYSPWGHQESDTTEQQHPPAGKLWADVHLDTCFILPMVMEPAF